MEDIDEESQMIKWWEADVPEKPILEKVYPEFLETSTEKDSVYFFKKTGEDAEPISEFDLDFGEDRVGEGIIVADDRSLFNTANNEAKN